MLRRLRRADPTAVVPTAALVDAGWEMPWGIRHEGGLRRAGGEADGARGHRGWTPVGPAGGPIVGVDPAGLVTLPGGHLSVDWWIGADDRWRLPAAEASLRQEMVVGAPAVVTTVRVPGGDAVHSCWAVPGAAVIEVENRSPSPFALAFAVRPISTEGAGRISSIAVEASAVIADGQAVLVLAARPSMAATSTGAQGDVAASVLGGGAGAEAPAVSCPDGLASAAVLIPVAHRTRVRVAIPLGAKAVDVAGLPSLDAVVGGWGAQERSLLGLELPDMRLAEAIGAARRSLLLLDRDAPGSAEDAALVVAALAGQGCHAEAGEIVRSLWARERTDGSFDEPTKTGAPGGPHLLALAEMWSRRPDHELVRALDAGLQRAVGWVLELAARGRLTAADAAWARVGAAAAGAVAGEAALAKAASLLAELSVDDRLRVTGPNVPSALAAVAGGGLAAAAVDGDVVAAAGQGFSSAAAAAFLLAARDLLVLEPAPGHAVVLPVPDPAWSGQGIEVHRLPLRGGGVLSFAVRWHGSRPALLWEVSGAPGPVRLTAPGYDAGFVSVDPKGETLLDGSPAGAEGGT